MNVVQQPALTDEQKRLVAQWIPYSHKLAYDFLRRRPHLRYLDDLIHAEAMSAGVKAVTKWRPADGTYPACLAWWVMHRLQEVEAQHNKALRIVGLSEAAVVTESGVKRTRDEQLTLEERLPSEFVDPATSKDAAHLYAKAESELTRRLTSAHRSEAYAREGARFFIRHVAHGERLSDLAREKGINRQALDARFARIWPVFEQWAREIRKEAA